MDSNNELDEGFNTDESSGEYIEEDDEETQPKGNDMKVHKELQDYDDSEHIPIVRGSVDATSESTGTDSNQGSKRGKRKCREEAKCLHQSKAHRDGIMLEVIRDDLGNFVGDEAVKFRSFLGKSLRQIIPPALNYGWQYVAKIYKDRLWEYLLQYYVLYDCDYKYVMHHGGVLMRGWKTRIKKKLFTKRKDSDNIFDVPKIKHVPILQSEWNKFVRYCASKKGMEFSEAQRQRGLKNDCRALVGRRSIPDLRYKLAQLGEVNLPRYDIYLRARMDSNGQFRSKTAKDLQIKIAETIQKINNDEVKLGPREDILQKAMGKPAPYGRAATGGIGATLRSFFGGNNTNLKLQAEIAKLIHENDEFKHLLKKAESQGFKFERVTVQHDKNNQSDSKKKIVKKAKSKPQKNSTRKSVSHESSYKPDMTNINQGLKNTLDPHTIPQQTAKCARQSTFNPPITSLGNDMFDALLQQESTPPDPRSITSSREYSEQSSKKGPAPNMSASARPLGGPTERRVTPPPNFYMASELQSEYVQSQMAQVTEKYCWLALDSKDVFVAKATYHGIMKEGEMLHNVVVGNDIAKVSVVGFGVRCESCPLMIPTRHISTLEDAINTFIAWPKAYISMQPKVLSSMPRRPDVPEKGNLLDQNGGWCYALFKRINNDRAFTKNFHFEASAFGYNPKVPEYLWLDHFREIVASAKLEIVVVTTFCGIMFDKVKELGYERKYNFAISRRLNVINPKPGSKWEINELYKSLVGGHVPGRLTIVPFCDNYHWELFLVSPERGLWYWMDSLDGAEPLQRGGKIVRGAIKKFLEEQKMSRKIDVTEKKIEVPIQQDAISCGYYVMMSIHHIIHNGISDFNGPLIPGKKSYEHEDLFLVKDMFSRWALLEEGDN